MTFVQHAKLRIELCVNSYEGTLRVMDEHKKKWVFCLSLLLAGALAGGFGWYFIFKSRLQAKVDEEMSLMCQHMASQRWAEGHLGFLEALDRGSTNDFRKFQLRGRAVLTTYVGEVAQIKKRYGYAWCPMDADIFQRAQKYLATHPKTTTNAP